MTEIKKRNNNEVLTEENFLDRRLSRNSFFKWTGLSAAVLAVGLQACEDDDEVVNPPSDGTVDLGTGDIGILNYAYALEQLEAAFYMQSAASFYAGISDEEKQIITDIKNHEIAHREFFKAALGDKAIPGLDVDFSAVDFTSRASVLGTAKTFEDVGVSAYNGAGYYIENSTYLLLAGKIVSVEARHAAAIRDLLTPKSRDFAGDDIISASTGLGLKRKPSEVLPLVDPFIKTKISANNLP